MKTTTETGIDRFLKMFKKASAVCLDQSVVMPQDAAEQGSREADEPNAVRDVMAAVDGINCVITTIEWLYDTRKNLHHSKLIGIKTELISISEQLSTVAEKLNKAAK